MDARVADDAPTGPAGLGHNTGEAAVVIEVRFFNSLAHYAGSDGLAQRLSLPAGSTVGDIIARYRIPRPQIFLVLRNGRAEFVPVKTGIAGERYFEVLGGVQAGDQVITGPLDSVRDLADGDEVALEDKTKKPATR